MLIARLKARLVTGETVELLPVRHETDVKKEVTALLEGWASSRFLVWGEVRLSMAPGADD